MKNLLSLLLILLLASSCQERNLTESLDEFCAIAPEGWECEIITADFSVADIPRDAPEPLAIVKYANPDREFEFVGDTVTASLVLDLYPAGDKRELENLIADQAMYSWCIPIYFGKNSDFYILTSPCFRNSGSYTDDANASIEDLYEALGTIIDMKE